MAPESQDIQFLKVNAFGMFLGNAKRQPKNFSHFFPFSIALHPLRVIVKLVLPSLAGIGPCDRNQVTVAAEFNPFNPTGDRPFPSRHKETACVAFPALSGVFRVLLRRKLGKKRSYFRVGYRTCVLRWLRLPDPEKPDKYLPIPP
jgi:hypothetical protein